MKGKEIVGTKIRYFILRKTEGKVVKISLEVYLFFSTFWKRCKQAWYLSRHVLKLLIAR